MPKCMIDEIIDENRRDDLDKSEELQFITETHKAQIELHINEGGIVKHLNKFLNACASGFAYLNVKTIICRHYLDEKSIKALFELINNSWKNVQSIEVVINDAEQLEILLQKVAKTKILDIKISTFSNQEDVKDIISQFRSKYFSRNIDVEYILD